MADGSLAISVSTKLFIGFIPSRITEDHLKIELSKYGRLVSLFCMPDQMKQNNGWAFVTFEDNRSAALAIDALNGKMIFDGSTQPLEVVYASQRNMSDSMSSGLVPSVDKTYMPSPTASNMSMGLWQQFTTAEGVPYYYNVSTGQTQWQKPMEMTQMMIGISRPPVVNSSSFGPPGANLFVFHVPATWNDIDLIEHFKHFGTVISARVQRDSAGRNRGFGFISYDNPQSALIAIKNMNGFSVGGKYLKVQLKKGEEHFMQNDQFSTMHAFPQTQSFIATQIHPAHASPKYQMQYNPY